MKTRLLAASAILAATSLTTLAASPAAAACDPGTRAVQYLAAHQMADGGVDMSSAFGFGNPVASMDAALGIAANGYDPNTVKSTAGKSLFDYLAANAATATSTPRRAAKLVLTLEAGNTPSGRFDPDNFGGVHPLSIVSASYHAGTGAYDDGASNTQALAILAVRATGGTPPALAVTWLKNIRNTGKVSGGYSGELATDTGWSTGNAADQAQGDTNSTAVAIEALAAVSDQTQDSAARAFLHDQQNPDGGFPLEKPSAFGTASDADSDALVLEALRALGDPLSNWTVAGNTPLSNLLSMQDASGGGFTMPSPDTFTTSQVPQGLVQVATPVAAPSAGTAVPAAGCPAAAVVVAASPAPVGLPRAGQPGPPGGAAPAILVLAGLLVAAMGLGVRRRTTN
jgi:hypothetical protein